MNRIRETREGAGISQVSLRRQLGWKQSRLANYESGVRTPGLNEAREIVSALVALGADCNLDQVFPEPSAPMPVQLAS
ncbi:helix-turn-helix transcriptional regulator [Pseudomonas citronellolis]|uniref:helix-turn-helix transcriptional regulator n=1 Tax=Pseudomonas citronellolis TaxID=53408 RepID=UPI00071898EB|nr:helix-turn-helix transcriptional regulator [Pseudomonas citronellolis]KRV72599.1 XRE family transcriptional regulator [Pseudomonas citronellolis]KRW77689.1 XRE family transcriptional regulator [Pseudomonas citronellolis]